MRCNRIHVASTSGHGAGLLGNLNGLGGQREGHPIALVEQDGLALVRHAGVHHAVVPVVVDGFAQALVPGAPAHLRNLHTGEAPLLEAVEVLPETRHCLGIHKVDKGIAQGDLLLEAQRHVEEIKRPGESWGVHAHSLTAYAA